MLNDTICAISTPLGKGGIGIVRLSGSDAFAVVQRLFLPARPKRWLRGPGTHDRQSIQDDFEPQSHRLYYGHIRAAGKRELIDEVLVAFMRAPHTYTREDVVEINAHSGYAALNGILLRVVAQGVRQAAPGEFTQRAFLNGRIDLNQVEGVIDTINAESQRQLQWAQKLLSGHFTAEMETLSTRLSHIIADIEASLEFGDQLQDCSGVPRTWHQHIRENLLAPVNAFLVRRQAGTDGDDPVAVLAGGPNVGKSSLMNRLAQQERSIVTPWPGTTRDTVNARLRINGCGVEMIDTAGLHSQPEPIERLGIQRAEAALARGDILVHVLDAAQGLRLKNLGYDQIPSMAVAGGGCGTNGKINIIVLNKSDLLSDTQRTRLPDQWNGMPVVATSALKGEGLIDLQRVLSEAIRKVTVQAEDTASGYATIRQSGHLKRIGDALQNALDAIDRGFSGDLVIIDLKEAAAEVQRMIGKNATPDNLDALFERFCIGK